MNKIFTKVLTYRLKPLLPQLISQEQSAFLSGRDITDNVLLAQELIQHLDRRVRGANVAFKLDMMKAFDRVSWRHRLLIKFGFPSQFVTLVMNNLRGSWFSVLLNGSPTGFFQSSRGIKQGDPLSPYLFISEVLSRGLNQLLLTGRMEPYALPRGFKLLSHLSFADDIIIFTRGTMRSVRHLFAFTGL